MAESPPPAPGVGLIYAGVGARDTPAEILQLMQAAAEALYIQGYTARSGHADGSDRAVETGAMGRIEVYLPWPAYNQDEHGYPVVADYVLGRPKPEAIAMMSRIHPKWEKLGSGGRNLHGRNAHILLGRDLVSPVKFVLCWTENGWRRGGTGTTIRLADKLHIPVFNLWDGEVRWRIERMVESAFAMEGNSELELQHEAGGL